MAEQQSPKPGRLAKIIGWGFVVFLGMSIFTRLVMDLSMDGSFDVWAYLKGGGRGVPCQTPSAVVGFVIGFGLWATPPFICGGILWRHRRHSEGLSLIIAGFLVWLGLLLTWVFPGMLARWWPQVP